MRQSPEPQKLPNKKHVIIWGWTKKDPSFLMLVGGENWTFLDEGGVILDHHYRDPEYQLWQGLGYHLPSFKRMGLKKQRYYYRRDSEAASPVLHITHPDSRNIKYEEIVRIIKQSRSVGGFEPVEDRNEILKLDGPLMGYFDLVVKAMSHPYIYVRKSSLEALIRQKPPKALYQRMLSIGSPEFVCGVLLALAKHADPVIKDEATDYLLEEINWGTPEQASGIRRCARIYLNAIDPEKRAKQVASIRDTVGRLAFWPTVEEYNAIPNKYKDPVENAKPGDPLDRNLVPLIFDYGDEDGSQIRMIAGPVNSANGRLKPVEVKHLLQQAEVFDLPDVVAAVAHFLDTPIASLVTNDKVEYKRTLRYLQRCAVRLLNTYSRTDEARFFTAIKDFLIQFTPEEYVCKKYRQEFAENAILCYYLYNSDRKLNILKTVQRVASAGWRYLSEDEDIGSWRRLEYMPAIWDKHIDMVAEIAEKSKIKPIWRFAYLILRDSPAAAAFFRDGAPTYLVKLTGSPFLPLADIAKQACINRVKGSTVFDPAFLVALIDAPDPTIQALAPEYMERHSGMMSPELVGRLVLSPSITTWRGMVEKAVARFSPQQLDQLLRVILQQLPTIVSGSAKVPSWFASVMRALVDVLPVFLPPERKELCLLAMDVLGREAGLPEWLAHLMQDIMFSLPKDELFSCQIPQATTSNYPAILYLVNVLRDGGMPLDSYITSIVRDGSPVMVEAFARAIDVVVLNDPASLLKRKQTLLLMLESPAKQLFDIAVKVFNSIQPGDAWLKEALLGMFMDSPVEQAYQFGLDTIEAIHGSKIPKAVIARLMEHGSPAVKAFVAGHCERAIGELDEADIDLLLYYARTLLLLPSKCSAAKTKVYGKLKQYAVDHPAVSRGVEQLLADIGTTSVKTEAERALVTLAQIRMSNKVKYQNPSQNSNTVTEGI